MGNRYRTREIPGTDKRMILVNSLFYLTIPKRWHVYDNTINGQKTDVELCIGPHPFDYDLFLPSVKINVTHNISKFASEEDILKQHKEILSIGHSEGHDIRGRNHDSKRKYPVNSFGYSWVDREGRYIPKLQNKDLEKVLMPVIVTEATHTFPTKDEPQKTLQMELFTAAGNDVAIDASYQGTPVSFNRYGNDVRNIFKSLVLCDR